MENGYDAAKKSGAAPETVKNNCINFKRQTALECNQFENHLHVKEKCRGENEPRRAKFERLRNATAPNVYALPYSEHRGGATHFLVSLNVP